MRDPLVDTAVMLEAARLTLAANYRYSTHTPKDETQTITEDRAFGLVRGDYDLTGHLNVFGEVLASRLRGSYISSPAFPIPPPFTTVPANHVDNPFGQAVQFIGRPVSFSLARMASIIEQLTSRPPPML